MRAVNLIPAEEQRGAGGAAGRSGGAVYIVLGFLAVLVLIVVGSTLQHRGVAQKRDQLAGIEASASAAEARAAEVGSFTRFAGIRDKREQTVASLAASRFDWSHAMRELARVIPSDVWLTSLQSTIAPGVSLKESAASGTSGLRSAMVTPAIEVVGCTTSQKAVAGMLTRMRLIDGVVRASLASAEKAEATAEGASTPTANSGDCRQGDSRFPQFQLVVFFDQAAGAVPSSAGPSGSLSAVVAGPTGATGPTGAAGPAAEAIGATP